ncbi:MAG: hypothetical protein K2X32_09280, partial [Phycisphaerales bacterium]|nr:hypothetical protein [Phycisphaerales bacterium]
IAATDYLALVDVPLFADAAGSVPSVTIDDLYLQLLTPRDWNNDGVIDSADARDLESYLRRNEPAAMSKFQVVP